MNRSARWTLLIAAILTGLVLCAVPMLTSRTSSTSTSADGGNLATSGSSAADSLAAGEKSADGTSAGTAAGTSSTEDPSDQRLPACPAGAAGSGGGSGTDSLAADAPLRTVTLPCLGNGTTQAASRSLAENLAGKPTVMNIWAWWCQPCRAELPHVAELATKHPEWNVVGVHDYTDPDAGIHMLNDLHISNLASFQDGDGKVIGTLGLPAVIPITVVLRADGTVAKTFVQVFDSTDQLEQAVQGALG